MRKKKGLVMVVLLMLVGMSLFSGEVSLSDSASFNLTSRTSFGIDLDNPYRYGLKQELTTFELVINLVPYQKLTNRVQTDQAVGFVNLTLFNLDLVTNEPLGYNAGVPESVAYLKRNRFQTGEFLAGIAKGNWIFQMNAGANEPFWSPWNKGLQFINDKVRFTWAYLDSMVDVKRITPVSLLKPEDSVVTQFQQDTKGATDSFGLDITGATIAALYNLENRFGLNLKFATEYPYNSEAITPQNKNGIAAGFDMVVIPEKLQNLKVFISGGGSYEYGIDSNPDPIVVGGKAGYVVPLNESLSLEPFVGTDVGIKVIEGKYDSGEYEVSTGITMRWPGQGGWYTDYILDKAGRVFPGMSLAYKVYNTFANPLENGQHAIKFTLFEPRGDEGVFYGIGSEIIADVVDLTSSNRSFYLTFYMDYTIPRFFSTLGAGVPWLTLCYDNLPDGTGRKQGVKVDGGFKLVEVIPNTILGMSWNSGDILNSTALYRLGYIKMLVEIKY